jgi:MFS family permease
MTTQDGTSRRATMAMSLLVLINLFNYIDRQILAAVESRMEISLFPPEVVVGQAKEPRDASIEWKMGSLNTAFMVSYMLIAPLFGFLADRMSRWFLVGIGVIVWSLATGATGLVSPDFSLAGNMFLTVFLARCLVGIGEAAYGPVAPTIISDLYPVEKRGSKMALFYVAIPVGSALGYVTGGLVTAWADQNWGELRDNWRYAFYVVVPFGLVLGLWCFRMKDPPRGFADSGAVDRKATWDDYLAVLKTPSYLLTTLGMTAMTFAMGGMAFWMPRYAVMRGMGDLADVNVRFGIVVVVSGLAATILGGIAGDNLKARIPGAYFLVSAIAMGLAFFFVLGALYADHLVARFPNFWNALFPDNIDAPITLFWTFIFLACFCLFFNTGPTNTILANVTHPSVRASAFALNILIIHGLGDAISPPIIGLINGYAGNMTAGFLTVSFMCLVASLLWFLGIKHLERDTALAPHRLAS